MPQPRELSKPVIGLVFVLGWAIGITLWSLSHLAPNAPTGAFVVDLGILFVCIASATPFLPSQKSLQTSIYLSFAAVVLFAFGDFVHVDVVTFTLRIIAPLLALMAPVYKLLGFRIFA